MRSVIVFLVLILIGVLVDSQYNAEREPVSASRTCEDVCCVRQESNTENLTTTFERCCNESTECLLPEHFYNVSCIQQFMNFCASTNRSTRTNITSWKHHCCSHVNCSGIMTKISGSHRKCSNIVVDWRDTSFPAKHDLMIEKWTVENWTFFLKMASQSCSRHNNKARGPSVTYKYPFYTKRENSKKTLVYGYRAPPVFLLMNREDYHMFYVVGDSLKNLWLTMSLCFTWTLISGVIIWLLDRRNNPLEFPSSFWEGVREGAWWAVVTMATVGYGDKAPKSLLARIYSAFWMIVGMVILSMFTAEVASRLTSKDLMPHHSILGKRIGVPVFSKRYYKEQLRGGKITEMESNELDHMITHLRNRNNGMDRIVLHNCNTDNAHVHQDLQSVLALEPPIVGISTKNRSLVACVRKMVELHHGDDNESTDEGTPECKEDSDIDKREYGRRKVFEPSDDSNIILYASVGLVVVMFVAGSVWDLINIKAKELQQKEQVDVEDSGSVGINEAEGPIEIRVIKEEEGGRHT